MIPESIKTKEDRRAANELIAAAPKPRSLMVKGRQVSVMRIVKASRVHKTDGGRENGSPWLLHGSRGECIEISNEAFKCIIGSTWVSITSAGEVFHIPKEAHALMPEF